MERAPIGESPRSEAPLAPSNPSSARRRFKESFVLCPPLSLRFVKLLLYV